jgi:hypothetical protein
MCLFVCFYSLVYIFSTLATSICIRMHLFSCACILAFACAWACPPTCIEMHFWVSTYMHVRLPTYKCPSMFLHTCMFAYLHTGVLVCFYARAQTCASESTFWSVLASPLRSCLWAFSAAAISAGSPLSTLASALCMYVCIYVCMYACMYDYVAVYEHFAQQK